MATCLGDSFFLFSGIFQNRRVDIFKNILFICHAKQIWKGGVTIWPLTRVTHKQDCQKIP